VVGDELPPPEDTQPEADSSATLLIPPPVSRQKPIAASSSSLAGTRRSTLLSYSECDRPDSGFDSKDDQEEEPAGVKEGEGEEEGGRLVKEERSPELGEMSRQGVARQPVKKKRVFHHNLV
jgi:hypothetical protein